MSSTEYSDYIDDADPVEEVSSVKQIQVELPIELRGERIDKAIAKVLTEYSRSKIQQWLEAGLIYENERQLQVKDTASGQQILQISVPNDPQNEAFLPENIPLKVVFSDENIAIIDKPYGMVVHPAAGNWSGTLLNALLYLFPECSQVPRAGIVHRLDKDTSGLLVIAKNSIAQLGLVKQLQDRSMQRKYLALAWGKTPTTKVIHGSIGRDPRDRLKMGITLGHGKEATTHLQTLCHAKFEGKDLSLLSCQLETGRTHQIRVHLESIGHALVNDPVYKNRIPHQTAQVLKEQLLSHQIDFPGQFLHAGLLGFMHPITHEQLIFSQPASLPMLQMLDFLQIEPVVWQKAFETCN
jgi:23S rRNA pseudouridine1911/1915/1917 synthase